MRIFVDLSALARKITGIERYTLNITSAILSEDNRNEYTLYFRRKVHDDFLRFQHRPHIHFAVSPFTSQLLTEQVAIPTAILGKGFDHLFFPCFPPSPFIHKRLSVICYDATLWRYKHLLSVKNRLYFRPLSMLAYAQAERIFTISESSYKDISLFSPDIAHKVVNISAAIPDAYGTCKESKNARALLSRLGVNNGFLLAVGSLEPRKNLTFVIENILDLLVKYDLKLVLVGRKAWGSGDIAKTIRQSNCEGRVITTEYLTDKELMSLYSSAKVFLFPSLYEGFGFPILEAFACGCPVITSNTSSMPEVAGDAALLIDPSNGSQLRQAVESIMTDHELRMRLINRGLLRKKAFSWSRTANAFLAEIEGTRKQGSEKN